MNQIPTLIMRCIYYANFMLFMLLLFACSKSEETKQETYDPNIPIEISDFSPTVGSAATKIVISGRNFGSDTSQVRVHIGEKQAKVIGVSPTKIYATVPRRLAPTNTISVTIADQQKIAEKQFEYQILQSVNTLSGRVNADGSGGQADGPLAQAMYNDPKYLAIDNENNLFVLQYLASKNIRKINIANNSVSSIPSGPFSSAYGITIRRSDNTPFICDRDGAPKTMFQLSPFNSWQPALVFNDNDNIFSYPLDIVYSAPDNVFYIQEYVSGKIIAIDGNNFVSLGEVYRTNVNELNRITLDREGNLYIARTSSHYILKVNPKTGTSEVFAGAQGATGAQNGPKLNARFNNPEQMVFDDEGNLFVADRGNHCIRKISVTGEVSVYGGQPGKSGYADGAPQMSLFNQPTGLAFDSEGTLYVADWKNHRIRTIIVE